MCETPSITVPVADVSIQFHDLGRAAYAETFEQQRARQAEVIAARDSGGPMHIMFVEHDPPVVTVSRRKGAADHLVASPEQFAAAGVQVEATDRGGDVTYHGPGQLVAYPILDLNAFGLRLHGYMRLLEEAVIDTIAAFGVTGVRDEGATGVWVPGAGDVATGRLATGDVAAATAGKIAAMGVRVSRWVSMHGLALNVAPNLEHFALIVPCGLHGRRVTSLAAECAAAGSPVPSMDAVKASLLAALADQLRAAREASRGESDAAAE
ncbi:MAG: lipoyl(octanoyl) transferase LipB [Phycisphaerales bacterium]